MGGQHLDFCGEAQFVVDACQLIEGGCPIWPGQEFCACSKIKIPANRPGVSASNIQEYLLGSSEYAGVKNREILLCAKRD